MILDKINDVNYRIQSLSTRKQLTVHVNRLKLWHGQTTLDSMDADLSLPGITDDSGAVAKARWQPNHPSPMGIVVSSGQPTTMVVHSEQPTNTMVSSGQPTTTWYPLNNLQMQWCVLENLPLVLDEHGSNPLVMEIMSHIRSGIVGFEGE